MPETNDTRLTGTLAGKTSEFRDRIVALGALLAPEESNNVRIARIREVATFYVGEVLAAGAAVPQEVDRADVPTF